MERLPEIPDWLAAAVIIAIVLIVYWLLPS